jgi:hypothetical protein
LSLRPIGPPSTMANPTRRVATNLMLSRPVQGRRDTGPP